MRASSRKALAAVVALIVIYVLYRVLLPPLPPDEVQIQSQINTIVAAAQNKDITAFMRVISADYSDDNGFTNDALKFHLENAMGGPGTVEVGVANTSIVVDGDSAQSVSFISVKGEGFPTARNKITLDWKKEDATRLLVLPTKAWRVVHANYPVFGGD